MPCTINMSSGEREKVLRISDPVSKSDTPRTKGRGKGTQVTPLPKDQVTDMKDGNEDGSKSGGQKKGEKVQQYVDYSSNLRSRFGTGFLPFAEK